MQDKITIDLENWHRSRTLVIAWLAFFFPVGLWGLWASDHFRQEIKIAISAGVAVAFVLIAAVPVLGWLWLLFGCPAALYLVWTDRSLTQIARYGFSGGFALLFLIAVAGAAGGDAGGGSGMARTLDGNGCTYYRDSSGNVIGRSC